MGNRRRLLAEIETIQSEKRSIEKDFDDKNKDYQRIYLETSLEEFAKDGNIDAFIRSLQHVVKARGRGAISALAKELDIDRSNLSDILNGKVQPKISTTLKLINGLGYKIQLKRA